jgi:hypothetical protein
MNDFDASDLIKRLKGRKLSSIEFVMDYKQFLFDGIGLTVNNPITIIVNTNKVNQRDLNFNNNLIGIIGSIVTEAVFLNDEYIELHFETKTVIRISLNPLDYTSPEGVIFIDSMNNITSIW